MAGKFFLGGGKVCPGLTDLTADSLPPTLLQEKQQSFGGWKIVESMISFPDSNPVASQLSISDFVVVVQSLSRVLLFATPWTAAQQASLSFTISQSLLKLTSIESVMLCNRLVLCRPFLLLPSIFPASKYFLISWLFASGGPSIRVSASAAVLPMNIQD